MKAKISGVAHYVSDVVVNNDQLAKEYGTITSEQILVRTGIQERRYSQELTTAGMATKSVEKLLETTGTRADEIDCLIVGTLSSDYFFPSTAVVVIKNIKAVNAFGFDMVAACPSFLFALEQAQMMIQTGKAKKVIVCGSDRMSKTINAFEHKTGVLFGDAAASVLVEVCGDDEKGINNCYSKVVADDMEDVYFRTPFTSDNWSSEKFNLDGRKVYEHGVGLTAQVINEFLQKHSLTLQDFRYIIPHQANLNMLNDIATRLNVSPSMFLTNLQLMGNTAGASVPLCLSQKFEEGIVQKGDRLLLVSFGSGYTLSIADLFF
jgi:3-oxoacyl-[acyl-carrier-protein] synthase-3